MQIQRETSGANLIVGCRAGEVRLREGSYSQSLAISADSVLSEWRHGPATELSLAELAPVLALGCDILILGTGQHQHMPPPVLYVECAAQGVGLEVMDNQAACRTFNVLLAEGRRVAVALML